MARDVAGEGPVTAGELPGGLVVSTWHLGAHDELASAYVRVQAWLRRHGHRPRGPGWEIYHWIELSQEPDPTAWPPPSSWRTQLIQPIT